jgi:hypothetical protein
VQLYGYFVSQSSEFCRHNALCCFSMSVYCCKRTFLYRFCPETFGYTLILKRLLEAVSELWPYCIFHQLEALSVMQTVSGLGLPSGLLPSGLPTKILYTLIIYINSGHFPNCASTYYDRLNTEGLHIISNFANMIKLYRIHNTT